MSFFMGSTMPVIRTTVLGLILLAVTSTQIYAALTAEQKHQQWISGIIYPGGGISFRAFTVYTENNGEHSVILTFLVAAVGTVPTPDPRYRYTWHSAVLTCDHCSPHTTTHRSA